ncbi:MAG: amidase [Candidatus Limnocylindria bacterium]
MSAFQQIALAPAHELRRRVASRELSPVEILDAAECMYEQRNPDLNAIVTSNFDAARRDALEAEQRLARNEPVRTLEGLPLAVKDSVPTAGVRTTYGSPLFRDNVPTSDALHVSRLRAAGAILVGKTNTPEFEVGINTRNPVFGQTVNPWDHTLGCGGSSGGSAVALATGMCALADGTDHGGSVRIPASLVGVVGMRPSPGRVPLYPSKWVYDTLSVPGPLGRTVRDAALMLSVMAGPDPRVPISLAESAEQYADLDPDVRGWRVAWSRDLHGLLAVDPQVASAIERVVRRFADLGCIVEEASPDWHDASEIIGPLRAHRTSIVMDELRAQATEIANPWLREFIDRADNLLLKDLGAAEAKRARSWERTAAFFARYRLLLIPATQWTAFPKELDFPPIVAGRKMSGVVEAILSTYAVTIAGLPALSVPCVLPPAHLPIGLQIVGGWRRDADVLRAGIAFEGTFRGTARPTV